MDKKLIPLDVISDPICPWCYIGKARLEAALAAHGSNPFDVFWRPYQLNPHMPPEGVGRKEYLEAKFGRERAKSFYGQIEAAATDSGLEVNFDAIKRTPNTIDAHRLIRWARTEALQGPVTDGLFRAYFVEGRDISDHSVLADVAEAAGMTRALVERLLASEADVEEVKAEDAQAREMGVNGVPCFIVAGKYVVNGAQPPDFWARVLAELETELTGA